METKKAEKFSYREIADKEKRKEANDLFTIHLYQEEKWLRAYDWSALLVIKYQSNRQITKLKAFKKEYKDVPEGIVMVGIPKTSIDKYFPNTNISEKIETGNKVIDVQFHDIVCDSDLPKTMSLEDSYKMMETFKNSIEVKADKQSQNKKRVVQDEEILDDSVTTDSIMKEIVNYNIERKSMMDAVLFLSDIKRKIAFVMSK